MTAETRRYQHPKPVHQRASASDLSAIRLIDKLPGEIVDIVAEYGKIHRFNRGEFLFFAGEPIGDVNFLIDGQVKVVRETEDGQEIILRLIQSGEMFGAAGGWGARKYPATAVALENASVFQLPIATFSELTVQYPDFAQAVVRELSARLREAEDRICELQVERVERRIARTLLRLAGKMGQETKEGIQIELPRSRQHLAELTGATLTTVSRVLSEWDRQGLILAGRERVTITKPHELVMIAEDFVANSPGRM